MVAFKKSSLLTFFSSFDLLPITLLLKLLLVELVLQQVFLSPSLPFSLFRTPLFVTQLLRLPGATKESICFSEALLDLSLKVPSTLFCLVSALPSFLPSFLHSAGSSLLFSLLKSLPWVREFLRGSWAGPVSRSDADRSEDVEDDAWRWTLRLMEPTNFFHSCCASGGVEVVVSSRF